jgi:hypothetical protein
MLTPTDAARAADAGVTAAVNPDATGTPPALATRVLDVGTNVLQDEHLKTGAEGQLQLLLRDGSTVTMGPNGDMTVDKFVYDPDANTAKLALTQTAGLLRIIGGRASKGDEGILVTTPTTTVGIRGGIARVEVNPQTGATAATLIYGKALSVNVDGNVRSVSRPGLTLTVLGKDQPPGPPTKAATEQVMRANALLEGVPGRTNPAVQRVTDNVGAIRSANANAPSAESTFAAVLSNPAFQALTNLTVGSQATQALVQNALNNAAALANLPTCNICFNVGIGGGLPLSTASMNYTVAGGVTIQTFGSFTSYFNNPSGPPITTAVPYLPVIDGTTSIQAGIINDASNGFNTGVINPRSLINTGSSSAFSTAAFLANPNNSPGHPAQYGAGGITAVTLNNAGIPTQIRNFFVQAIIDTNLGFAFPAGTFNGATIPAGTYDITGATAIASATTMTYNGASLAQRVGDNVMQAIRTTGGSGAVTTSATYATQTSLTNEATGIVYAETSPNGSYVAKYDLSAAFALSPSQSLHFILGQPGNNIPNTGVFTYNMIGATSPTFNDGFGSPGVFSAGALTLNWHPTPAGCLGAGCNLPSIVVNARVLMPNDALYDLVLGGSQLLGGQTTSTFFAGSSSITVTGASRVCPTPSACALTGSFVVGGPGGNRVGLTYSIGDRNTFPGNTTRPGDATLRISGAAVWAR